VRLTISDEYVACYSSSEYMKYLAIIGCCMPKPQWSGTDGLSIQVYIEVPTELTEPQREILQKLLKVEASYVFPERKSFFRKLSEFVSEYFGEKDEK